MSIVRQKYVVYLVMAFAISAILAATTTAGGRKTPDGMKRKTYNVGRLARGPEVMQLAELIQHVIEPQSWTSTGGQGAIDMKGKTAITVQQTPEVQKQVGDLIKALGKLPSTKSKRTSKSRKPKKPVLSIPVGKPNANGQSVVVYNVQALMGNEKIPDLEPAISKITSTIAPKTWAESGGEGAIEPFSPKGAVVILQSKQVHEQLIKMLEKLNPQELPKPKAKPKKRR